MKMKKLVALIAFCFIGHNANAQSIWLTLEEIMQLPTEGQEWKSVHDAASANWGSANVSDQNSDHDTYTLAGALVYARTGEFHEKTKNALLSAIGTEKGSRWLAIGRNLTAYAIAADLMNLRSDGNPNSDGTKIQNWLALFLTGTLKDNNSSKQEKLTPFESGSNASAQEGAVYIAIAAYLNAPDKLEYAWNRFRLYSGDKTNNPETEINIKGGFESGWSHADRYQDASAVNPKGATKNGRRIDGVIINDQRRGGSFDWPPGYTSYPWVGLEGYMPAALILHRMGYPAFEIADAAVYRAVDWLWYLREQTGNKRWFDGSRSAEIVYLANKAYEQTWNHRSPVGAGRTIGFTDWSHKNGIGGDGIQQTSISGAVKHANTNAPLEGVEVKLIDGDTQIERQARTSQTGQYFFAATNPGSYEIVASKGGFEPASIAVSVEKDQQLHANDILLKPDANGDTQPPAPPENVQAKIKE